MTNKPAALAVKFDRQEAIYQRKRRESGTVHQHIGASVDLFRARLSVLAAVDPRAAERMASAFIANAEQVARQIAAGFVTVSDAAPHTAHRTAQSVGVPGAASNARARAKRTAGGSRRGRGNRT